MCTQTLKGYSNWVKAVAFSHDLTRLASTSADRIVKIWDAASSDCIQTLNIDIMPFDISFDTTGSCLHTKFSTIVISKLSDSIMIPRITRPRYLRYHGWAISLDGL
jgi:WD40 repeat protein